MKLKVWVGITLACSLLVAGGALTVTMNQSSGYLAEQEPPDPLSAPPAPVVAAIEQPDPLTAPLQTAAIEQPDPLMHQLAIPVGTDLLG